MRTAAEGHATDVTVRQELAEVSQDGELESRVGDATADHVGSGGTVFDRLRARVRALLNKDELPVIIQADSRAEHGVFSDVWSEVKNAGAKKISVSTRND